MSDFEPKIIAFLCNWCSYAGADLAGVSRYQYPPNIRPVRVMCSTRVSPHIILELFREGVDGVMVAGCHIGDCHYMTGNYYTEKRIELTEKLLELAGLDPSRLRLEWVSASEGEKFASVVTDFVNIIRGLGPSPVKSDEKLAARIAAASEAARTFRLKVLNGKEIKLTEKGNVYGEVLDKERFKGILEKAAAAEFERCMILQLANNQPRSVKELAEELGDTTDRTLEQVVSLRSRNLLALDHTDGFTPKYKTIIAGGA